MYMVRPTLEFALTAWDHHKQKDAQLLEKVKVCPERVVTPGTVQNCSSTAWSGTALNNAGSTTDSRCCTGSTLGWSILTSPASATTQISGQEEPSDYIRSIPAKLSYLPPSFPTLLVLEIGTISQPQPPRQLHSTGSPFGTSLAAVASTTCSQLP